MPTHDTASDRLRDGSSLSLRHFFLGAGIQLWAEGSCANPAIREELGLLFLVPGGIVVPKLDGVGQQPKGARLWVQKNRFLKKISICLILAKSMRKTHKNTELAFDGGLLQKFYKTTDIDL